MPEPPVILEIFGEGKTDIGSATDSPQLPTDGVLPILVHTLCGKPQTMRVKRKAYYHLQGKNLSQKVRFAKLQAYNNAGTQGVVFVMDTEGNLKKRLELTKARDHKSLDFPMAVGVAHPCIEAWLLADGPAIQRALQLAKPPDLPQNPEDLPSPNSDSQNNPKAVLQSCTGVKKALQKSRIAKELKDVTQIRERCPQGFAPFADEVGERLKPLFE